MQKHIKPEKVLSLAILSTASIVFRFISSVLYVQDTVKMNLNWTYESLFLEANSNTALTPAAIIVLGVPHKV